ncbi:hypothetical protein TW81_17375 [Vibrio galatheae]|uniref:DUF6966 domain-containing protein n=2 Tax=Vibrio galatheae TaxID=579748 RepID=A0A0F4NFP1_9VIBR|nr:hypothetical protein TW81_17375 [Vibrio galatheae]
MRVISIIKQIIDLLVSVGESNWADTFTSFKLKLVNSDSENLQILRSDILGIYGGMGSFNDLVLYSEGQVLIRENQTLDKLRKELFEVLN